MSQIYQTEGVILQALDFQDYDRILTVYSQNEGLIKLIVKGANRKKIISAPLTAAQFIYTKGRSELFKCQELSLLSSNLQLRQSLKVLEAACDISQAILTAQLLHVPSQLLYQLMLWSFGKLGQVADPFFLALSFRLKLLRHEGLLHLNPYCACCAAPLHAHHIGEGEAFCAGHAPANCLLFSEDEVEQLYHLAYFQDFKQIEKSELQNGMREKVHQIFKESIQR